MASPADADDLTRCQQAEHSGNGQGAIIVDRQGPELKEHEITATGEGLSTGQGNDIHHQALLLRPADEEHRPSATHTNGG